MDLLYGELPDESALGAAGPHAGAMTAARRARTVTVRLECRVVSESVFVPSFKQRSVAGARTRLYRVIVQTAEVVARAGDGDATAAVNLFSFLYQEPSTLPRIRQPEQATRDDGDRPAKRARFAQKLDRGARPGGTQYTAAWLRDSDDTAPRDLLDHLTSNAKNVWLASVSAWTDDALSGRASPLLVHTLRARVRIGAPSGTPVSLLGVEQTCVSPASVCIPATLADAAYGLLLAAHWGRRCAFPPDDAAGGGGGGGNGSGDDGGGDGGGGSGGGGGGGGGGGDDGGATASATARRFKSKNAWPGPDKYPCVCASDGLALLTEAAAAATGGAAARERAVVDFVMTDTGSAGSASRALLRSLLCWHAPAALRGVRTLADQRALRLAGGAATAICPSILLLHSLDTPRAPGTETGAAYVARTFLPVSGRVGVGGIDGAPTVWGTDGAQWGALVAARTETEDEAPRLMALAARAAASTYRRLAYVMLTYGGTMLPDVQMAHARLASTQQAVAYVRANTAAFGVWRYLLCGTRGAPGTAVEPVQACLWSDAEVGIDMEVDLRMRACTLAERELASLVVRMLPLAPTSGPAGPDAPYVQPNECTWERASDALFGPAARRLVLLPTTGALLYDALSLLLQGADAQYVLVAVGGSYERAYVEAASGCAGRAPPVVHVLGQPTSWRAALHACADRTLVLLGADRLGTQELGHLLVDVCAAGRQNRALLVGDTHRRPRQPAHACKNALVRAPGCPFADLVDWAVRTRRAPVVCLTSASPLALDPSLAPVAAAAAGRGAGSGEPSAAVAASGRWSLRAAEDAEQLCAAGWGRANAVALFGRRRYDSVSARGRSALYTWVPGDGGSVLPVQRTQPCPDDVELAGIVLGTGTAEAADRRRRTAAAFASDVRSKGSAHGVRGYDYVVRDERTLRSASGAYAEPVAVPPGARVCVRACGADGAAAAAAATGDTGRRLFMSGLPVCTLEAEPSWWRRWCAAGNVVVVAQEVAQRADFTASELHSAAYDLVSSGVSVHSLLWVPWERTDCFWRAEGAQPSGMRPHTSVRCVDDLLSTADWAFKRPCTGLSYELDEATMRPHTPVRCVDDLLSTADWASKRPRAGMSYELDEAAMRADDEAPK